MNAARVVAIVQARTGSTRLPNKVLADLGGAPMLERVVERALSADRIDEVVVATTTHSSDDPVDALARSLGRPVFRGSEDDVLGRYAGAARSVGLRPSDVVVRITADCPLLDPSIADEVVRVLVDGGFDYASNTLEPRTSPRGLDVEAFTVRALFEAEADDRDPRTREHVTPWLYRHPERYRLGRVDRAPDRSSLRLTVDTPEDLELVRRIYAAARGAPGSLDEIAALFDAHPEWRTLNAHVEQKRAP
jgi:spore coat polysaccharide biosynthesis protein SpsF